MWVMHSRSGRGGAYDAIFLPLSPLAWERGQGVRGVSGELSSERRPLNPPSMGALASVPCKDPYPWRSSCSSRSWRCFRSSLTSRLVLSFPLGLCITHKSGPHDNLTPGPSPEWLCITHKSGPHDNLTPGPSPFWRGENEGAAGRSDSHENQRYRDRFKMRYSD